MALQVLVQDVCGRCGKKEGELREATEGELQQALSVHAEPVSDDDDDDDDGRESYGLKITLGADFGCVSMGGLSMTLENMCDNCTGTVADHVNAIMRRPKLTAEQNPFRRARKKKGPVPDAG